MRETPKRLGPRTELSATPASQRLGSVQKVSRSRAAEGSHRIPPEDLTDDSPLIRDDHSRIVRPISPARIHDIVHDLNVRAGLLPKTNAPRYELRAHSVRKYFRSQLAALGVNNDYINYMMGHVVDTYHDIQMKGPEFLRNLYAGSGLSIRPKTLLSKVEMAKQVAAAMLGITPEQVIIREAQAFPHRSYATPRERDEDHIRILSEAIRQSLKKDLQLPT